jgi:hypothetical protein
MFLPVMTELDRNFDVRINEFKWTYSEKESIAASSVKKKLIQDFCRIEITGSKKIMHFISFFLCITSACFNFLLAEPDCR